MNRIDRLFAILTLLQAKKFVPAEKIAEKFSISTRTVYRDIKALCESGIPVSFEQHKGYFIVQGYFLPPVSFTNEEANALLLMEAIASGFTDKTSLQHYSAALNKIKAVLRNGEKEKADNLSNSIKLQVPSCYPLQTDYLSILQQAISSKDTIEIEYKNNKEEVAKRLIEPIGLLFYAFNWHLIAWCQLRNDYRDFRVSRIQQVKNVKQPFSQKQHIALNEYMKKLPVNF